MERMIAYCGLVCSECPAYLATQAGDMGKLKEVAASWSEEFDTSITVDNVICDGCVSEGERKCSYCHECEVRACAAGRGVLTCAHCDDFGCEIVAGFFEHAPEARTTLEEIRAGL
ncbi:MAG: DUF3795 domain-containing protein [Anaerolineae bacterium]|jgi:hypothetical protein